MDHLTRQKRSWNMSRIKSIDTKPEKTVRSVLHNFGYRFRLHKKELPGKPDIFLKKYNTAIFVNGCFWHGHKNCLKSNTPKTNKKYWTSKIEGNIKRDKKNIRDLKNLGYKVYVVWECETKNQDLG